MLRPSGDRTTCTRSRSACIASPGKLRSNLCGDALLVVDSVDLIQKATKASATDSIAKAQGIQRRTVALAVTDGSRRSQARASRAAHKSSLTSPMCLYLSAASLARHRLTIDRTDVGR